MNLYTLSDKIVFNILKDSDIIDEINNQQITIKYTHSFDLLK